MDERIYIHLDGDSLYAPGTSVPVGAMTEFAVLPVLAAHVAQIAVYRDTIPDVALEHIIPDGAVRMIFDLGTRRGCADVAGPSTCPVWLRLEGEIANLTVILRPGAAAEILGTPAVAVRGQCISLNELWPGETEAIAEKISVSRSDSRCSEIVQAILAGRLARSRTSELGRARRALQVLACGGTIRAAANRLGIGERRLQQVFETAVGLSPRQARRLARIHACIRSLRKHPRPRWREFALDHGFFDQAHLANEFNMLVGLTPTEYVAKISGSSKTNT